MELTNTRSRAPSPSASKNAPPAPIVSGRYFFSERATLVTERDAGLLGDVGEGGRSRGARATYHGHTKHRRRNALHDTTKDHWAPPERELAHSRVVSLKARPYSPVTCRAGP